MDKNDKLTAWKVLKTELILQTPWFNIEKRALQTPNGAKPTFYIHDTHDSVMCVCVTDDKKVLIERQYRPALRKVSIDYPAGRLEEDDKSIEEAMLRELKEETGYQTKSFQKIAIIDKDPSFSTTRMHVFLAEGAIAGSDNPEETESIVSQLVPAAQVFEMVLKGEIACAFCVSATLHAFEKMGWLQLKLN